MILKAYKYRIYPTSDQATLLNKTFGCCRVVWNRCVESFNAREQQASSTELKKGYEWMSEVSASALQQKVSDFIEFKRQFFNKSRKKSVGRCKFKTKHGRQSYRLPNQKFTLGNNFIRLEKVGRVRVVIDRRPTSGCNFRSVTVSREPNGNYYVSVLVKESVKLKPKTGLAVGIDLGLESFATLSDGTKFNNPKFLRDSQAELKKAQRSLSRKKKGSTRRAKAKKRVARIHKKISNQRHNFLHVLSSNIISNYDVIGIEDLNIGGMVKNHKLAKSIQDASWGKFVIMLEYKAAWYGKTVQRVSRWFPSTQMCNCCGLIKKVTLKDRMWICECGNKIDRDHNSSVNLRDEALRLLAQGVTCA